jgi:hypothetical protein
MNAGKASIALGAAAFICTLGTFYLASSGGAGGIVGALAFGPVLFGASIALGAFGLVCAFVGAKAGALARYCLSGGVLSAIAMLSSGYMFWAFYRTLNL